jgi:hypothetical protein
VSKLVGPRGAHAAAELLVIDVSGGVALSQDVSRAEADAGAVGWEAVLL